jgi:CRISPR-associated endonuclease/helicase Cas3
MEGGLSALELWAHTPGKADCEKWQPLEEHLVGAARLAKEFAGKFGCAELGWLLGLLHDVGKASKEFQDYLRECWEAEKNGEKPPPSRVDHKLAGAVYVSDLKPAGQIFSMPILGHHGGLRSRTDVANLLRDPTRIEHVRETISRWARVSGGVPTEACVPAHCDRNALGCETLLRFLFSCLVDADFLDTETHWFPERANCRGSHTNLPELWKQFETEQLTLLASATGTPVNGVRREVYEACIAAAAGPQGVFRLTVPTGGGKTRSGMAFALKHALAHELERVIVTTPYTSIIDQNADVYRQILGDDNVLVHHSSVGARDREDYSEDDLRAELAVENWDAPIIVTTSVQLFESLFSHKPSKCRKLHNLARSVIVLDEVQTLPIHLVQPILDILRELVEHYGVTLVLSTATQPAFAGESPYLRGFREVSEIVPKTGRHFIALERVEYAVDPEPWSWEHVADEIRGRDQVLCVLNSRRDALGLFRLFLDDPNAFHLSTLMYPAHRREVLAEIRRRLRDGLPCRVVSTQVVEAGVDLDFPCVMRAFGPLDRIVQAAGRCNREGLLECGEVIVFRPAEESAPRGTYATAMCEARRILETPGCNLHDPQVFDTYFTRLWQDCNLDSKGITTLRKSFAYPEVAQRFRMIEDDTMAVVVRWGHPGPEAIIERAKWQKGLSREDWRRLQQFTVSVYQRDFNRFLQQGLVSQVVDGLYVWEGVYDPRYGLSDDLPDPTDLIA